LIYDENNKNNFIKSNNHTLYNNFIFYISSNFIKKLFEYIKLIYIIKLFPINIINIRAFIYINTFIKFIEIKTKLSF